MARHGMHDTEKMIGVIISENLESKTSHDITNSFDLSALNALEIANVVVDIDDEFGVKLTPKDFNKFENVGALVKYVQTKLDKEMA